ncbi:bifunctional 6-phosphofructo-2-kinase/fructose-2,6-bisphosphate 2-phosphatase [Metschnikowia bicuspidata var. bicuspidata NRRL YB-4993]|uniref:fructose-2,6-bisphosphate 2-phosphatase n=1 Tax=Metschnikowia bicuspidata var. bicuspidata NRRL YB-4993 TaxID=869754 RepID=A0A1A0H7F5_9ASCO|nr:bifunctional 6-phosphofructo-2-kinase/fructose-2,6-bisphosphate 2-phosphatase [Metschnikowia bicuspidata var. bicuspidata NRRL YB-4993]OBA19910.1 bifunctional 6-phosphofructo-2-kinase/fructose-2,6-bisphosphate 2-phosphatase [Metschnikowia bicuspidata var. bicuspidata NRRL YB-4993]
MPVYSVSHVENVRICVIMVGLPARGKSLIAQKIVRYLLWLSIAAKCFSVGSYRRALAGTSPISAEFFSPDNEDGIRTRGKAIDMATADMMRWFTEEHGVVGIIDATNLTRERRARLLKLCRENLIEPIFLESWCDDPDVILYNSADVKTTSPDYVDVDPNIATKDFLLRIQHYEKTYETMNVDDDKDLTFIKLVNVGSQIIVNRIESYLESRIVYYVMNLHIKTRSIWLLRHGESEYNLSGKIGGDCNLSERGWKYAKKLPEIVLKSLGEDNEHTNLTVWTSTLKRTQQTASFLPYEKKLEWKALDELDAGECDGMTYEEIEEQFPEDFKARDDNKYEYRYRGGESYRDIVIRLEPIIMELERQENILIITHQAVLRCLYAYFMNVPQEESPWMSIPLHTLIKLEPRAYLTLVTRIKADIPAVSTYKERGTSQLGELEVNTSVSRDLISNSSNETPGI